MRKRKTAVTLMSILLISCFIGGMLVTNVSAEGLKGIDLKDIDTSTWYLDIEPYQAFDAEKLQRTVTVDGEKKQDVLVVKRESNEYRVISVADDYERFNTNGKYASFEDFVDKTCRDLARAYVFGYPNDETVTINGIPWQQTKYSDTIKKYVAAYIEETPSDPLGQNPYQWEIAQNPKYNGFGEEIFINGMSLSKAEQKNKELREKASPAVEPIEKPVEIPVELPAGDNIKLTMTLDKTSYTVKTQTDTQTKTLDVAPFAKNGVTLVPVRGVFEAFDAEIEWLPETKQVKIVKDKDTIILTLNSKTALVNEKKITLLEPAQTVNGRTLIPLRFISENLGYDVTWVSQTKQIVITD